MLDEDYAAVASRHRVSNLQAGLLHHHIAIGTAYVWSAEQIDGFFAAAAKL